jgi:hypothetical protein
MELLNLRTEVEKTVANRSRVYQLLAVVFSFPDAEFFESIRDGTLAAALGGGLCPDGMSDPNSLADFITNHCDAVAMLLAGNRFVDNGDGGRSRTTRRSSCGRRRATTGASTTGTTHTHGA